MHHQSKYILGVGGIRRFIEIARRIKNQGVTYEVIESYPSILRTDKSLRYNVFEVRKPFHRYEAYGLSHLSDYIECVKTVKVAIKLLRRKNFDLLFVTAGESFFPVITTYLLHIVTGIPWTVIIHSIGHSDYSPSRNYIELRKRGYSRLKSSLTSLLLSLEAVLAIIVVKKTKIITVSNSSKEELRKMGVKSEICVVDNGICWKEYSKAQVNHEKVYDGLFVGRLTPSKGIFDAVSAWKVVVNEFEKAKLVFIGHFRYPAIRKSLEDHVRKLGLKENIEIKGFLSEKEKIRVMKRSKIFVFPSKLEGWGLVVAEAMAAGLPVVCYDIPAIKEVFNCPSVVRVQVGDVNALGQEVCRMLGNDDLRRTLGEIGRSFVKRYDWDEVVKKEAQAYAKIAFGFRKAGS
jgi:glycosyltransferase involved in cell wall biosynthesis